MADPQFSPKYIEMAGAAKEIQADPKGGEWWCRAHNETAYFHHELEDLICHEGTEGPWRGSYHSPEGDDMVWLPRLDQLLEMLPERFFSVNGCRLPQMVFIRLWEAELSDRHYFFQFQTESDLNCFVLAVVMRDKYGKTWEDGQWLTL